MCIEFRASLLSDLLQYSDVVVLVVNMSLAWHKKLKLSRTLLGLNASIYKTEDPKTFTIFHIITILKKNINPKEKKLF